MRVTLTCVLLPTRTKPPYFQQAALRPTLSCPITTHDHYGLGQGAAIAEQERRPRARSWAARSRSYAFAESPRVIVNRCRSAQRAYLALAHNAQQSQVSRLPLAGWQFSTDLSALLLPPAHRDMQPEAHRVENTENSCEVWLLWIARKRTVNALPREPRSVSYTHLTLPTILRV